MSRQRAQYLWYMAGVCCFVIPGGIQTILFPWLITVRLSLDAQMLGIAQMCMQLPALGLILFGGLLADRIDARKILVSLHLLAALPAAGLALLLYQGTLGFAAMIAYALATGTIGAFIQPARDSILNRIAMGNLQQTVTVTMGLTFGAQVIGYVAAGAAEKTGPIEPLLLQSVVMLLGAGAALRLDPMPPRQMQDIRPGAGLRQILEGLRIVVESSRMWPTLLLLTCMSTFYGGTFSVLNPIIVRDLYAGNAARLSMSFGIFVMGTITMTVMLVARGGLARPGRGLVASMIVGGVILLVAATRLSFEGYLACLFCWGMSGAIAMSMSRTIMQESAPENYRARVLSIFSLANLGGMPIGAVAMGYVASEFGPLTGLVIAATITMVITAIIGKTTPLWRMQPAA